MASLSLTACADPGVVTRLEIDDLANFPELQNKVLWSHSGQCYYRRIPGKTVEWDSETQTLVYGASPASSVAHARPASCTPFVWFWRLRERFWRRDHAAAYRIACLPQAMTTSARGWVRRLLGGTLTPSGLSWDLSCVAVWPFICSADSPNAPCRVSCRVSCAASVLYGCVWV